MTVRQIKSDKVKGRAAVTAAAALTVLLATASLVTAGPAVAANDSAAGKTPKVIDIKAFSCEAAVKLKQTDGKRYAELVEWLAGWLAEPTAVTDLSLRAIAKAGEEWAAACTSQPTALLRDVAKLPKDVDDPMSMAAIRCEDFLILNDTAPAQAMGIVRWFDGWNANALDQTTGNFYYHKKQLDSVVNGCMKYPRRAVMYVVGGRLR